jgi:hypothetical protein
MIAFLNVAIFVRSMGLFVRTTLQKSIREGGGTNPHLRFTVTLDAEDLCSLTQHGLNDIGKGDLYRVVPA